MRHQLKCLLTHVYMRYFFYTIMRLSNALTNYNNEHRPCLWQRVLAEVLVSNRRFLENGPMSNSAVFYVI